MMFRQIVAVAVGGALGATARFLISEWCAKHLNARLPVGTLTANLLGCFLIGMLTQASLAAAISPMARVLLVTGLLGSLTTFSTFGLETMKFVHQQDVWMATCNVLANLVLGLLSVTIGLGIGRLIWQN